MKYDKWKMSDKFPHLLTSVNHPIVPGHPVRQDVINTGCFDGPTPTAKEQERAALPNEVGLYSLRDWEGATCFIKTANRICASEININIPAGPREPLVKEVAGFRISNFVSTSQPSVNHVEMRVAVTSGGPAQLTISVEICPAVGRTIILEADEIVEIDVVKIKSKILVVIVEAFELHGDNHCDSQQSSIDLIKQVVLGRIDVTAHL